jgi:hypothetical protein
LAEHAEANEQAFGLRLADFTGRRKSTDGWADRQRL